MEYIGVVVKPHSRIGLGGKVVVFLEGIDEHVNKGVYQKEAQKQKGGQQIQKALWVVLLHVMPPGAAAARRFPG